jgi:hypothetical protein
MLCMSAWQVLLLTATLAGVQGRSTTAVTLAACPQELCVEDLAQVGILLSTQLLQCSKSCFFADMSMPVYHYRCVCVCCQSMARLVSGGASLCSVCLAGLGYAVLCIVLLFIVVIVLGRIECIAGVSLTRVRSSALAAE